MLSLGLPPAYGLQGPRATPYAATTIVKDAAEKQDRMGSGKYMYSCGIGLAESSIRSLNANGIEVLSIKTSPRFHTTDRVRQGSPHLSHSFSILYLMDKQSLTQNAECAAEPAKNSSSKSDVLVPNARSSAVIIRRGVFWGSKDDPFIA